MDRFRDEQSVIWPGARSRYDMVNIRYQVTMLKVGMWRDIIGHQYIDAGLFWRGNAVT